MTVDNFTTIWFEQYIKFKQFNSVMNLGVFAASDITGWFIDHSDLYEKIYLIDNYDFSSTPTTEDPDELIRIVNKKINKKQNIEFIIKDGNLIDYTKFDFDLAILDCDSTPLCEKIISEKPDIVFCYVSFMNSFSETNEAFKWINNGMIYPFLYLLENP